MSNLPNIENIMNMNKRARAAFIEALGDEQVRALRQAALIAATMHNEAYFDTKGLFKKHLVKQQAYEYLCNLCFQRLDNQGEFSHMRPQGFWVN